MSVKSNKGKSMTTSVDNPVETTIEQNLPTRRANESIFLDSFNKFGQRVREAAIFTYAGLEYSCDISRERFYRIESDISDASSAEFVFKLTLNDKPAAILQFTAYRLNGGSGRIFVETCDASCQQMYDMAEILNYNFDLDALRKRDVILSIDRVAVHPDFANKGLVEAFLKFSLGSVGLIPVITIIHAFPLEYEGSGRCDEPEFHQLQAGLIAYYHKTLNALPVLSSHAKDGWMYSAKIKINEWAAEV